MSSDPASSDESSSDSSVAVTAGCADGAEPCEAGTAQAEDCCEGDEFPVGCVVRLVGLRRTDFNGHIGRVATPLSQASGRIGIALHGAVWPSGSEDEVRRRSRAGSRYDPIALKPENLRHCPLPVGGEPAPSVLGSVPGFAIMRLLGESGWGLQDTIAEHIAELLRIRRVDEAEIAVVGCSSWRGDYPISVALNDNEHEWWIS